MRIQNVEANFGKIRKQSRRNGKAQDSNPNEDRRCANFIGPTGLWPWETEHFPLDPSGRFGGSIIHMHNKKLAASHPPLPEANHHRSVESLVVRQEVEYLIGAELRC